MAVSHVSKAVDSIFLQTRHRTRETANVSLLGLRPLWMLASLRDSQGAFRTFM